MNEKRESIYQEKGDECEFQDPRLIRPILESLRICLEENERGIQSASLLPEPHRPLTLEDRTEPHFDFDRLKINGIMLRSERKANEIFRGKKRASF